MTWIRPLTDVEYAFAAQHRDLAGTTQVTTWLRVDAVGITDVPERLRRWSQCHELLSVALGTGPDGRTWFCGARSAPDIAELTHVEPEPHLTDELNDIVTGPWRLCYAHQAGGLLDVFFTRNHVISDGYTTAVLMRSLLTCLVGRYAPRTGLAFALPEVGTTSPPLDWTPRGLPALPRVATPLATWRAHIEPVAINAARSRALRHWCTSHGVSVNQALCAALAHAYSRATGRGRIGMFTSVSTRGDERGLGCRMGVLAVPITVRSTVADTARQYRLDFQETRRSWRPLDRTEAEIDAVVAALRDAPTTGGVCVTNVGEVTEALGPHAGRIRALRTVVNRRAGNYAVVLHVLTVRGQLDLALGYGTPAISPETARAIAAELTAVLGEMALVSSGQS